MLEEASSGYLRTMKMESIQTLTLTHQMYYTVRNRIYHEKYSAAQASVFDNVGYLCGAVGEMRIQSPINKNNSHRYHSLILVPTTKDIGAARNAIYKRLCDYLSSGYAVIYTAEP